MDHLPSNASSDSSSPQQVVQDHMLVTWHPRRDATDLMYCGNGTLTQRTSTCVQGLPPGPHPTGPHAAASALDTLSWRDQLLGASPAQASPAEADRPALPKSLSLSVRPGLLFKGHGGGAARRISTGTPSSPGMGASPASAAAGPVQGSALSSALAAAVSAASPSARASRNSAGGPAGKHSRMVLILLPDTCFDWQASRAWR